MKNLAFALAFILVGCDRLETEPMPCWMEERLANLLDTYEFEYDVELTEAQANCVMDMEVAWLEEGERFDRFCEGAEACYYSKLGPRSYEAFVFRADVPTWPKDQQAALASHEGVHRLLACLGERDEAHAHEMFAGSRFSWGGVGSLVRAAMENPADPYYCE